MPPDVDRRGRRAAVVRADFDQPLDVCVDGRCLAIVMLPPDVAPAIAGNALDFDGSAEVFAVTELLASPMRMPPPEVQLNGAGSALERDVAAGCIGVDLTVDAAEAMPPPES
jgi:hypothetical protein